MIHDNTFSPNISFSSEHETQISISIWTPDWPSSIVGEGGPTWSWPSQRSWWGCREHTDPPRHCTEPAHLCANIRNTTLQNSGSYPGRLLKSSGVKNVKMLENIISCSSIIINVCFTANEIPQPRMCSSVVNRNKKLVLKLVGWIS